MKYSVITFGCRVNQADSLSVEEGLLSRGNEAVTPEEADLVVVNTCSVTASADQAARQTIRRIAGANPAAKIVVTGCYATRQPSDVARLPGVATVVQNDKKPQFLPLLLSHFPQVSDTCLTRGDATDELSTAERFGDGGGGCGLAVEPGVAGRTAFTLRVQTGCAEPCSYCIIPKTRGVPRSEPLGQLLTEVGRIVGAGFKEIALTGVHLGSYGRDLGPSSTLVQLLHAIRRHPAAEAGTLLFRVSSLEPMDCTRDVISVVAGGECFAPHFHLPLQHASNRVLEAMQRPYTIERYAETVDDIRARLPHAAIGSDIIVGFPGESEQDFDELVRYLEGSPLTHLHVFPYSDRPGTTASAMREKVAGTVIRERGARIRAIGRQLSDRFKATQLGAVHRGLTLDDGRVAVTGNYLKVKIPAGHRRNEWIRVKITAVKEAIEGEVQ